MSQFLHAAPPIAAVAVFFGSMLFRSKSQLAPPAHPGDDGVVRDTTTKGDTTR